MRFAALIVTYRSAGHIGQCLASLEPSRPLLQEGVVVIDNASGDSTCDEVRRFAWVHLVENATNAGFAGAVNQGFRLLPEADAVLLLNPDVRISSGLQDLLGEAERTGRRVLAGLLVNDDGTPQRGFAVRRFPTALALVFENLGLNRIWKGNPVNRKYRALDLDLLVEQDVEQPAGAFLLIPRQAWLDVGGLNEGFWPAWFEDVDFLKRCAGAGWTARLVPAAQAAHAGGHSFEKVSWSQRQLGWYGNLLKYAAIHCGPMGRRMVALSVLVGSVPRALTGMFRQRSLNPLGVYPQLLGMAASQMLRASQPVPESSPGPDMTGNGRWSRGS